MLKQLKIGVVDLVRAIVLPQRERLRAVHP